MPARTVRWPPLSAVLVVLLLHLADAATAAKSPRRVAVLFSSFGDVESCACVDSYWPNALAQLVSYEIPTPAPLRKWVGEQVWKAARNSTFAQYTAISPTCNTSFQTHARAQAVAVTDQLRALLDLAPGDAVRPYVGYNFVSGQGCPANVTTVDQARRALADGATELVLVNQNNAQQSNTTNGVSYGQLKPELAKPEWAKVPVWGLDDYSQTPGFHDLVAGFVRDRFDVQLGAKGVTPKQTCLLFACHGNPSRITKAGDPGETYMRNNYAALQRTFAAQGFDVHLAFQNHGGKGTTFPQSLFPWSSPPDTDVVPQLANASCSHVLITGTISFVVDNSETLFDEAIDDRRMLNGKPAEVTPVFNADPTFAAYLGGVLARALNGTGPALRDLKKQ